MADPIESEPGHWNVPLGLLINHEYQHAELDYQIAKHVTAKVSEKEEKCCFNVVTVDCSSKANVLRAMIENWFREPSRRLNNQVDLQIDGTSSRKVTDEAFDKAFDAVKAEKQRNWKCSDL